MRVWDELLWKKESKATLPITLGNSGKAKAEGDDETGRKAALRHQEANDVARNGFSAASMATIDGQELLKPWEESLMMSVI